MFGEIDSCRLLIRVPKGWTWADPLCSLFIAILIVLSVWPLLKATSLTLLQRTPPHLDRLIPGATRKLSSIPGVVAIDSLHVWELKTGYLVGTANLQISEGDPGTVTREAGQVLRGTLGCRDVAVQVVRGTSGNGYGY